MDISISKKINIVCESAFKEGFKQKLERPIKQKDLWRIVWVFRLRNGYKNVIWQSYKAGLFARDHGDT